MLSLRALKAIGEERAHETKIMTDKINARALEFEQKKRDEAKAEEEAKRRQREAKFRPRCTRSICQQIFVDERAKDRHYMRKCIILSVGVGGNFD